MASSDLGDLISRGVIGSIPAAGTAGRLYVSTDEDKIYRDNGSTWDEVVVSTAAPTLNLTKVSYQMGTVLYSNTLSSPGRWDVSSISQAYTHLLVRCWLRGSVADTSDLAAIFFNNDTTATNYMRSYQLVSDGAAVVGEADHSLFVAFPAANSVADDFGYASVMIPLYAGSHRKLALADFGCRMTAAIMQIGKNVVNWESTAAINRITIQPDGYATDTFATGSYIEIIGIAAADIVTDGSLS